MPDLDGIERFAREPFFGCAWCQRRFGFEQIKQHRRICGPKYRQVYGVARRKNTDQELIECAITRVIGDLE